MSQSVSAPGDNAHGGETGGVDAGVFQRQAAQQRIARECQQARTISSKVRGRGDIKPSSFRQMVAHDKCFVLLRLARS